MAFSEDHLVDAAGGLLNETQQGRGVDKRIVLLVAAMASFLTPFMGTSVNL
jgi:hypothetical protein